MVGHGSLEPGVMVRVHLLQPEIQARVVELADTYV